jgi:uncharacterized protein (TIRG00374 family)
MKKKVTILLRILFTLLLCGYVLYKAGIFQDSGKEKFLELLAGTDYRWVLLSLGVTVVLNFLSALKWRMLLQSRGSLVGLCRLYIFYNIGKFFNLILPTSMGGDVVRVYLLGEYIQKKPQAAASVIVERFTGLISMLVFALIAMLLNLDKFNQKWLFLALFVCILIAAGILWYAMNTERKQVSSPFSGKTGVLQKILKKIALIRNAIREYADDRNALIVAMLNSFAFQFGAVINVWVSARVFSDELSFFLCLITVPVIMFIMNLPFSIGGIGLMEFGYLFVFSLFNVSPALAVSIAMFIRIKIILDAFVGGLFYITGHKGESLIQKIRVAKGK